jgi:2-amino-4-hydroxy-6-hydroxymethyldihydropteridine diphosphokinase
MGDSASTLRDALARLADRFGPFRCSSVYRTAPVDYLDQPDFLNLVARFKTGLDPFLVLSACAKIEAALGRRREGVAPKGPRTIDIDILLYGELVLDEARLSVPHPRMGLRAFVLVPLLELWPDALDPRSGEPYERALSRVGKSGVALESPPPFGL